MLVVIMLARLNTPSEVSILPTGLGNHYTSSSRHLIPPGRRRFPYNHSVSSSDCFTGDPNAPEANMSFREQQEYFGPDVLVILGLILACMGAILTLISFYCQFKHPAIQATMAGIGPSLVGIGMLFCILRLFFCTFCIRKTCCECFADGLRFLIIRCPCCKYFRKTKKKIHPLQVKDIIAPKPTANGQLPTNSLNAVGHDNRKHNSSNGVSNKSIINNNNISHHLLASDPAQSNIEMMQFTSRMEPITESEEHKDSSHNGHSESDSITEVRVDSMEGIPKAEDDILKDEIDLLDEMKSDVSESPNSHISLHKNINELVLKTQTRY